MNVLESAESESRDLESGGIPLVRRERLRTTGVSVLGFFSHFTLYDLVTTLSINCQFPI